MALVFALNSVLNVTLDGENMFSFLMMRNTWLYRVARKQSSASYIRYYTGNRRIYEN